MGIRFNADEVFGMAVHMEANGAAFYRRAADLNSDSQNISFLAMLAEMEDGHKATFESMREELPAEMRETTAHDPYMEANLYLNAMVDTGKYEGAPKVANSLTGEETMEEILRMALGLEEKGIVFYLGLKEMVPDKLGKDKIDGIIAEEKSHIVTLADEIKKLKTA
jgi:rubrerythrin